MSHHLDVTDLMGLPTDAAAADEVGRPPADVDTSRPVWCSACGAALPLDAPADAHDHDFAGAVEREDDR